MPACTRVGVDLSAGHTPFPPRAVDTAGQLTVYINSILATVVGAHYQNIPPHDHDGYASAGSATVFIENKSVHRIGDDIDCGDISASGSRNVFAGG